jgi:hypothetical protein
MSPKSIQSAFFASMTDPQAFRHERRGEIEEDQKERHHRAAEQTWENS